MLRIIVLLAVMAPVVVQQAGCCAVKKTCCVEGTVLTKPTRWRSYFDFCIDTGCGEKKISIKGSGRAPYNALIDRGRYVSISGINIDFGH